MDAICGKGPGSSCLGALIGDYVGSRFEFDPTEDEGFELLHTDCFFTDDTILSLAVEDVVRNHDYEDPLSFERAYRRWFKSFDRYEKAGWGSGFYLWASEDPTGRIRTDSFGNGSVMRLSSIPNLLSGDETVARVARNSCLPTHNHAISLRAAETLGRVIYHLRHGADRLSVFLLCCSSGLQVLDYEEEKGIHQYTLLADKTVCASMSCVMAADSFEDAIRKAVLLGGDADTLAAVTGSMAEHVFGIPEHVEEHVRNELEAFLGIWM